MGFLEMSPAEIEALLSILKFARTLFPDFAVAHVKEVLNKEWKKLR
jgi:hypothetical protein